MFIYDFPPPADSHLGWWVVKLAGISVVVDTWDSHRCTYGTCNQWLNRSAICCSPRSFTQLPLSPHFKKMCQKKSQTGSMLRGARSPAGSGTQLTSAPKLIFEGKHRLCFPKSGRTRSRTAVRETFPDRTLNIITDIKPSCHKAFVWSHKMLHFKPPSGLWCESGLRCACGIWNTELWPTFLHFGSS